jgi:hypothetical protein
LISQKAAPDVQLGGHKCVQSSSIRSSICAQSDLLNINRKAMKDRKVMDEERVLKYAEQTTDFMKLRKEKPKR